jgi:16S rRNA (cytidine1402-2'-O)-methyltransferase
MTGELFLLPNLLGEGLHFEDFFPKNLEKIVHSLNGLIAESEKGGWRFLRHFFSHEKIKSFPVCLLNEHTRPSEIEELLSPLEKGELWGVVSDAGLTSIADPGCELVFAAQKKKIPVRAIPGPSSIVLALMLSGFSGQNFSFYGYLPIEDSGFKAKIASFEKDVTRTHVWMETPYRVRERLQEIVCTLKEDTLFCLALDLTLPTQEVIVETIREWKLRDFSLFHKRLAIFLIGQNPFKRSFKNK